MTTTTAERIRAHQGPAILALGFRPFFLAGAVWAALAMLAWLLVLTGRLTLPVAMGPVDWHVHAFLYGYLPAIAAGFLLTAVPNWTGRLPVTGWPLLALVGLWLAGRLAVLTGLWLGPLATAIIDLAFLAGFAVVVARELIAGANKRNLPVLLLLTLLLVGNAVFHLEVAVSGQAVIGTRLGIIAALMLIMLIGGRIVPSFTRNWLAKRGGGRLPAPMGRLDGVAIAVAGLALMSWMVEPLSPLTASLALVAGVLQLVRLGRWAGERTHGRAPRPHPASGLRLRAAGVPAGGRRVSAARCDPAGGRDPRLDGGRHRHHDASRDDPRQPRPFRPPAHGRWLDACDLPLDPGCGAGPHRGRDQPRLRGASAPRGHALGPRLRHLRRCLLADPDQAAASLALAGRVEGSRSAQRKPRSLRVAAANPSSVGCSSSAH